MKKHTQIYLDAFGYDKSDSGEFVPCEISERKAVDVHHIVNREDRIENLMALSREDHDYFGDKKEWMSYLLEIHRKHLLLNKITFNDKWFEFYINKYESEKYVSNE